MKMLEFDCPNCEKQVMLARRHSGRILPCPECGCRVFWPPPDVINPPKYVKLKLAVGCLLLLLALWVVTMLAGPGSITSEEENMVATVEKNFRNTSVYVSTPLPFVLGLKVKGTNAKNGGSHKYKVGKYYFWFFGYTKQIPGTAVGEVVERLSLTETAKK